MQIYIGYYIKVKIFNAAIASTKKIQNYRKKIHELLISIIFDLKNTIPPNKESSFKVNFKNYKEICPSHSLHFVAKHFVFPS